MFVYCVSIYTYSKTPRELYKACKYCFVILAHCLIFSSFWFHGLENLSGEKILLTSYPVIPAALKVMAI